MPPIFLASFLHSCPPPFLNAQKLKEFGVINDGEARGVDGVGQGQDAMVPFHSDHHCG